MTECTEYKYLGDHLNEKNNYMTTIEKRTKQEMMKYTRQHGNNGSNKRNEHSRKRNTNKAKTATDNNYTKGLLQQ